MAVYTGMMGDAKEVSKQDYRQNKPLEWLSGNLKAARIARSSLTKKRVTLGERWDNTLAVFSDYFIRY